MSVRMKMRRNELCVYCGVRVSSSMDHVIAQCLFPKPRPQVMVTVPACKECHDEKSADDIYLRDMLTLDDACSGHPAAQSLLKGTVYRSVHRHQSGIPLEVIRQSRLEPKYTARGHLYLGHFHTIPLDGDRVKRIFARIGQGLYYQLRNRRRFPDGYQFQVMRADAHNGQALFDHYKSHGANGPYVLGDVFGCLFAFAREDPGVTSWLLWFYGGMFIMMNSSPATLIVPA